MFLVHGYCSGLLRGEHSFSLDVTPCEGENFWFPLRVGLGSDYGSVPGTIIIDEILPGTPAAAGRYSGIVISDSLVLCCIEYKF